MKCIRIKPEKREQPEDVSPVRVSWLLSLLESFFPIG